MKLKKTKPFPRIISVFKPKTTINYSPKKRPNEFLYGLPHLRKKYPCLAVFSSGQKNNLISNCLEKLVAFPTKLGFSFGAFLNNQKLFLKNDLLFAVNDGLGFGLLFLKLLGRLKNPILVLIQGLHDRYQYFSWNKPLIYFYQQLLYRADGILVFSLFEKKLLIKLFSLNPQKVKVLFFGADLKYWQKQTEIPSSKQEFVLAVGNDMHRDYNLLMLNYNLKIPLKFITHILTRKQLTTINHHPLFTHEQNISHSRLKNLYSQAKFIVVPLKKTAATSGLSVILQALAMGKPVLAGDAPALEELFKDHYHLVFYKTNCPDSLKEKLMELNNDLSLRNKLAVNARSLIKEKFNSQKMGENLESTIKTLFRYFN